MVAKKGKKTGKNVKSLPVKGLSSKQAKGVKGGSSGGDRPQESIAKVI